MDLLILPGTELPAWAAPLEWGETVVRDDVLNAQYHDTAARALVSKGALDIADRSLEHYAYYLTEQQRIDDDEQEPTQQERDALVIGRAFHSLVLEPMVFTKEFVLLPDFGKMQSSKNRAIRDAWLADRPGVTGLKPKWWGMIHGMRESLFRHKRLRRLLENGRPEVTCAAIDPTTGLPRKCRWDWVSEIDSEGVDVKSAINADPRIWKLEAARRRYHVQDPFYVDTAKLAGLDVENMSFAVVEKEPPYVCSLVHLEPGARLAGERIYMRQMLEIAEAAESGEFPGYGRGEIVTVELPRYATAEIETIP